MNRTKLLGIALAATAVFLVVLGLAKDGVVDEFNVFWMAAVCAAIPGLFLIADKPKAAELFSRILVGSIFLVSGLIKANDTVGFGIKLEEYFDENALGSFWAMFHDYSIPIAFLVSGVEVLLGLAVLFGAKARLVSIVLLGMTLFFGWLTYFTAECNDAQMAAITSGADFNRVCVTDCGCFGDALRGSVGRSLTPWESFYKDLGLFFLTLVILFRSGKITVNELRDDAIILPSAIIITLLFGGWLFGWMLPTYFLVVSIFIYLGLKMFKLPTPKYEWFLAFVLAAITYGFATYTYRYLPVKDYRPYAVGENIKEQMKTAEELGKDPMEYANVYKLENSETGETKTMNSKAYLEEEVWKDERWEIVYTSPEPIVINRGYEAPIATFSVTDENGSDIGDRLINDENYSFMVVAYDVTKAVNGDVSERLNELAEKAEANGMDFYLVTSSAYEEYDTYKHENQFAFPFYTADEIFLKTIIRSNPGVLLLKNGTIVNKWHANDIPRFDNIQEL